MFGFGGIGLFQVGSSSVTISVGGGGEELPDPLVAMNFVTETYTSGASPAVITDLLGEDEEPGTTFNAGDIVSGSGLRGMNNGGTSMPSLIDDALAAFLGTVGCTVLVEYSHAADATTALIGFDAFNSPTWDMDAAPSISLDGEGGVLGVNGSNGVEIGSFVAGAAKVAIAISAESCKFSLAGGAVITVTPSSPIVWGDLTKAYIGNLIEADFIRLINIYAPQDDATLQALSA